MKHDWYRICRKEINDFFGNNTKFERTKSLGIAVLDLLLPLDNIINAWVTFSPGVDEIYLIIELEKKYIHYIIGPDYCHDEAVKCK